MYQSVNNLKFSVINGQQNQNMKGYRLADIHCLNEKSIFDDVISCSDSFKKVTNNFYLLAYKGMQKNHSIYKINICCKSVEQKILLNQKDIRKLKKKSSPQKGSFNNKKWKD